MRPVRRIPGGRIIDLGHEEEEGYYPGIYSHHQRMHEERMRELERREDELEERERRLEHAERMHHDGWFGERSMTPEDIYYPSYPIEDRRGVRGTGRRGRYY